MYTNNELLFPPQTVPMVRNSRGEIWQELVDRVNRLPQDHPENLAFSLTMIRLNGCIFCETDSYRAMRGCTPCTEQTLRRYKGSDRDILAYYKKAFEDIQLYLATNPLHLCGEVEDEICQARAA